MYLCGVLLNLVLCFLVINSATPTTAQNMARMSSKLLNFTTNNMNKTAAAAAARNLTYADTPDNSRHVPAPAPPPGARRRPLKAPRRTVQRIIKKQKARKKLAAAAPSSAAPARATPPAARPRPTAPEPRRRRGSTKLARYRLPFQGLRRRARSGAFSPRDEERRAPDEERDDYDGGNYGDLYDKFHLRN